MKVNPYTPILSPVRERNVSPQEILRLYKELQTFYQKAGQKYLLVQDIASQLKTDPTKVELVLKKENLI